MVKPASRMLRAISFGVFCRLAPSTRLIMRSRNPSPGSALTRTISQSESRRVPPVTAMRSPPASRTTGALSPVTALSSTEAIPTTISPSAGSRSPASTRYRSFFLQLRGGHDLRLAQGRFDGLGGAAAGAWPACPGGPCAAPRPAPCRGPRPGPRRSWRNSTVNHSQSAIAPMNAVGASPFPASAWIHKAVVNTLPTSTTNITGLRTIERGLSFIKGVHDGAPIESRGET